MIEVTSLNTWAKDLRTGGDNLSPWWWLKSLNYVHIKSYGGHEFEHMGLKTHAPEVTNFLYDNGRER